MALDMGTAMLIAGGMDAFSAGLGAHSAAKARQDQMKFKAEVALLNARMGEMMKKDADRRKQFLTQQRVRGAEQTKSTKRAKRSGGGLDINVGSPLDDLMDTELFSIADQGQIAINTEKEKVRIQAGINQANANASFFKSAADAESPVGDAFGAFTSSMTKVAGRWYTNKLIREQGRVPTR